MVDTGIGSRQQSGGHQPADDHDVVLEPGSEHRLFVAIRPVLGDRAHENRHPVGEHQPADLRVVAEQRRGVKPLELLEAVGVGDCRPSAVADRQGVSTITVIPRSTAVRSRGL